MAGAGVDGEAQRVQLSQDMNAIDDADLIWHLRATWQAAAGPDQRELRRSLQDVLRHFEADAARRGVKISRAPVKREPPRPPPPPRRPEPGEMCSCCKVRRFQWPG